MQPRFVASIACLRAASQGEKRAATSNPRNRRSDVRALCSKAD